MTQPVQPGIVFTDPNQGVQLTTPEQTFTGGANPLAAPARSPVAPGVAPDGGIDFAAIQQAKRERLEQGRADEAIQAAEQARLEAEHGQSETALTGLARAALDWVLAPAAILGAVEETKGKIFGMKSLEDFGRDFGRAATSRSAIEAMGGGLGHVFGGDEGATDAADRARIAVDEQEKAWPLLSTGTRIAGGVGLGIATGGLSAAPRALAAMAAAEGAGAGAQAAYDVDAPLTEVWTSALMGGTLGAGLSQVPGAIGAAAGKLRGSQRLAKVFGDGSESLGNFGDNRVAHSLGFTKQHYKKYGPEKIAQVARAVDEAHLADGTPVFPKDVIAAARMDRADIADNLVQAHDELGKEIGALRSRASQWIDEQMPVLRPAPRDMAARIRAEVAEPLLKSASEAERSAGRYVMKTADNLDELGESMSLEQFVQQRSALGAETNFTMATPKPQTEAMRKVYGMINDDLAARFERAADGMGETSLYRPLNQKYHLYEIALEGLDNGQAMAQGNNALGLSSNVVMAGTLAGDLATGGGYSALKALGAGIGHKLIMEKGPQVLATLARRFARTRATVDVAQAGGKEAQDALTQLARARKFLRESADDAGPNANVRANAENTAQEVATQQLVKLAGGFDRAGWATASRAPSPLARVLYRSQILDAVSQDLAPTVGRTAAMRPSFDFDLDAGRLSRLTRDAEATDAIASVQAKVREIADNYTALAQGQPSPVVDAFSGALERLNTADAAGAMAEGHTVARALAANGNEADARALQLTLGDDLFGQAGKTYRQMTAPPSQTLAELADPKKLREALRTLELRGQISQQIADEHRVALAAFDARKRLTGEAVPADVRDEMRAIEKMWARGEENVTLDGTRLGRIVDVLDNMTESRVAAKVPRVPEEQQVQATVQAALKPVEQTLRRSTGRSFAAAALRSVPRALSQKDRIAQYEQRLDTLAQVATQPDAEQQTAAIQEAPAGVRAALVTAQGQKVQQLLRDMPKPRSDIHGTAYDSLSSEEIRRGNAMWEATMEPMSVFEDFARGALDPDKVAYAWKQYPGLQQMAQLGVLDVLQSQMTAEERSKVPGTVLTQLDYMLGFKGGLQSTVSFEFSQRISGIHEQLQQQSATPSPPSKGLVLPTSKPTMTQRIAGAQ